MSKQHAASPAVPKCVTARCPRPAASRAELRQLLDATVTGMRAGALDFPNASMQALLVLLRFDRCASCVRATAAAALLDAAKRDPVTDPPRIVHERWCRLHPDHLGACNEGDL